MLASAQPTHKVSWPGCLTPDTVLVWYGQRCGANDNQVQWTGVYAADKATLQPVAGCQAYFTDLAYRSGKSLGAAIFGTCGVAPTSVR